MSYTIGPDAPPPFTGRADYYERSNDPFHVSATEHVEGTALFIGGAVYTSEPRRNGWMAIDYCENAVGFYPDGMVMDCEPEPFVIQEGYFADRRMFAYPVGHWVQDLVAQHNRYKEQHK